MPEYLTPGVYYERVDAAPGISAVRTDVAGFVGIAQRGPVDTPVPVQSWRQLQSYFGGLIGAGYLAYAVRAFFENGGARCWVVRVASKEAAAAEVTLRGAAPSQNAIWRIAAFSPGVWGNDLTVAVRETHRAQTVATAGLSTPEYSPVASVAGFARGTHVRLSQDGATPVWKVVSDVDAANGRLVWVHSQPESRLPYDAPLAGFNIAQPILIESVEYTVLVSELGRVVRLYEGLSLVPEHPRYGPRVLPPLTVPRGCGRPQVLPAAPEPVVVTELRDVDQPSSLLEPVGSPPVGSPPVGSPMAGSVALQGGADGLALLGVYDFVGEEVDALDSDVVKAAKRRGLRTLESVGEVSILAVPDIHIRPVAVPQRAPLVPCEPDPCLPPGPAAPATPPQPSIGDMPPVFSQDDVFQVQLAMLQQCEKLRDRIAILDLPFAAVRDDRLGIGAAQAWRSRFDTKYAALYYPWLRVAEPARPGGALTRDIPPCGHVAGQYARTDLQTGVHKAPANAPLEWAQDATAVVNDAVHGILNPLGINAIRALPGRGISILGARTVSSDPDWRFVNVRRLLMMIEKAIGLCVQWAAFEPNDMITRAKLRLALTSFLLALWQQGALAGDNPDGAFRVKCDEDNNPASERANGRLLAEVWVAPSQPFEFIILRVGRSDNEFQTTETVGETRARVEVR